ncbi:MAG: glycosyltransferase family 2 protein [Tannerellaceae bacterium]|nr:glycosyltransferase family 2 protein [Tannerellaceae bacterium]
MRQAEHTLSVIIPAFNEEATIIELLDKVFAVVLPKGIQKEVIVVDDASTDRTVSLVTEYIEKHSSFPLSFLQHPVNRGKGKAIRTGLDKTSGTYVVIQDADLECDPDDLPVLLSFLLESGNKVVYGSRFMGKGNKQSSPLFYIGGKLVTGCANLLYGQQLTDEPTCYKMFETDLLKSFPLRCEGFEFCPEVTARISKAGHIIQELPIRYYPRTYGEGKKIKWKDGVIAIWTLLKYRFID